MIKVAAGIVLYNPDLSRLKDNIDGVMPQVDVVILIDNGSTNFEVVKLEYAKEDKLIILRNEINLGVATALNQLVRFCDSQKYEWVLALDQDSVVPYNLIDNYLKYILYDRVAILTPQIADINDARPYVIKSDEPDYQFVDKCITSASLINIKICMELGGFDEIMFIDLVDFEYCLRVRKRDYRILRLNKIYITHQLGDLRVVSFFGKKIHVTNHSCNRLFYYSRNSIYYMNKHYDSLKKKTIIFNILKKAIKVLLFEKEKVDKLKSIFNGIVEGNKMGINK